jgi:large subunit ribosomal protein L9
MDLSRRSAAEVLAKDIEGTELTFERRASEKDVLFGSVSVADIAKELTDKGFDIDRRRVMLDHPFKELGNFEVMINIHRDIKVTLPVFVVRPGEEPQRGGEEVAAEDSPVVEDAVEAAAVDGAADEAETAVDAVEPEPEAAAE